MKRNQKTILWAVAQVFAAAAFSAAAILAVGCKPSSGIHTLHILTTGDVHGAYFDSTCTGDGTRHSLLAVKHYVDSVRNAAGRGNVLLLDAGDCLQGDDAAYYFNYEDTVTTHIWARMVKYMDYDAAVVGNHDIETGHGVYDRVRKELDKAGIPWLAANALKVSDGKPYFSEYKILDRAGMKVLVIGFTNANIRAWLDPALWSGMEFKSAAVCAQEVVDRLKSELRPDIVVVAMHSGTGTGAGSELESEGMDLYRSIKGVDLIVGAHDHTPVTFSNDSLGFVNAGARAAFLGHATVTVDFERGKVKSRTCESRTIRVDKAKTDEAMRDAFRQDYEAVREFTLREVGSLGMDIRTRDAYAGMSDYVNLLHTVQLKASGACVSFAAPLTFDAVIPAGALVYADMFTIYPFENQLFVVELTGAEIKDYLEYSYDQWIQTYDASHVLRIAGKPDPATGLEGWSFVNRPYNFDSAAGLVYRVDITRKYGSRVVVDSMADGSAFDPEAKYTVALTSYRCNGRGWTGRVVARYPEIRELIHRFIKAGGTVGKEDVCDYGLIGMWAFMPQPVASRAVASDMTDLFGE